jgi:hypothetical protein
MGKPFNVIRWYERVRDDLSEMPAAYDYYKEVIQTGAKHVSPVGELERLHQEQPGLVHFYGGFQRDAIAVAKYLESLYEVQYAKKFKWFSSYEAKQEHGDLKVTDIRNFVQADDTLWDLKQLHLMAKHAEDMLTNLCESMTVRGYYITNLKEIHKHKLEHVQIDAAKDTSDDE